MSGKIEVKVRPGKSLDIRYKAYPEWYLEILGENGDITTLSPSFSDLRRMLKDILVHEFRVDATRKRKKDMIKEMKEVVLDDKLISEAQTDFKMFSIPKEYTEINTPIQDFKQKDGELLTRRMLKRFFG